ncbi:hypothetical protein PHLCEN_2v49 [Hermanssonia centrifuga]|uniref:Uncharacterized protein n=1 Tax=Hermanssonia centrifuga TaxID=98765 RepID=A0A2R6S749_9APHY|nr:hypothetical protein PHLCEN_2v49 [Hermanssonia centrifuga]
MSETSASLYDIEHQVGSANTATSQESFAGLLRLRDMDLPPRSWRQYYSLTRTERME